MTSEGSGLHFVTAEPVQVDLPEITYRLERRSTLTLLTLLDVTSIQLTFAGTLVGQPEALGSARERQQAIREADAWALFSRSG